MCKTPTGLRNLKIKRLGSAVQESSQRPSNLIGGSVKSFIKRQSVKKYDPSVSCIEVMLNIKARLVMPAKEGHGLEHAIQIQFLLHLPQ